MEKKKIQMGIQDGTEFFAHEMSINFNPLQFIFDFRSVTPRNDPQAREGPFLPMRHNVVLVDAFHAKKIHEVLTNMISEYEKKYGKIEKPKALKKQEKENAKLGKQIKSKKDTKETMPTYFG